MEELPSLPQPAFVVCAPAVRQRWLTKWRLMGGGASMMAFAIAIGCAATAQTTSTTLASLDLPVQEPVSLRGAQASPQEEAPPRFMRARDRLPEVPLDVTYFTLREWVHPIAAVEEKIPADEKRHFGARRSGIDRTECGSGHCGVDLHAVRGRPILAVSAGVLVRVERRRSGGDNMSGRFVKIRHADGTFTTYMHLDTVTRGFDVGDEVEQGQVLGTLGSTGVAADAPHLHFGLEIPNGPGQRRTDAFNAHYVDPAKFLESSRILDVAVRKHARKPAS